MTKYINEYYKLKNPKNKTMDIIDMNYIINNKLSVKEINIIFNNNNEEEIKYILRYKKIFLTNINNNKNIDWQLLSMNKDLNLNVIHKYYKKLNWYPIIINNINNQFFYKIINKYKDFINFKHLIQHYKLNESFIEEFIDNFEIEEIFKYQQHIGYYKISYLKERYY